MAKSIIYDKAYAFAIRIVKLYKYLNLDKKTYLLANQILKSGTSIGANAAEAIAAQSRKDFISKITIALKEARETGYWLDLLHDTGYIKQDHYQSIHKDCQELIKMLSSTVLTANQKDQEQDKKDNVK